jgi:hypothetical protein
MRMDPLMRQMLLDNAQQAQPRVKSTMDDYYSTNLVPPPTGRPSAMDYYPV